MNTCLVTGGAGFIGSHIAELLVRRGARVRVLDNLTTGRLENLAAIRGDIELIEGDIRDAAMCRAAMRGAGAVFHEAAVVSVEQSARDPQYADAVNVGGTVNLLVAARDAGVETFILASSAAVYGDAPDARQSEGREGYQLSPYAVGKLAAERYGRVFHTLYGLRTVSLRYFNVYGPRQNWRSGYATVIPRFISQLLSGHPPVIDGDGAQSRDFVFVEDVAEANVMAACAPDLRGDAFNIGSGFGVSINALARMAAEATGQDIAPVHAAPRAGDVRHSCADISRAMERLGYRPTVDIGEGLVRTTKWYREARRG